MTSDLVTIKEVERESIIMEDCDVTKFNWTKFAIIEFAILTTIIVTVNFGVGGFNPDIRTFQIMFTIFMFLVISVFTTYFFCFDGFPGWEVRILGHPAERVIIKKTTPEEDQKQVCQAAQSLESRAKEISKKKHEMERIAANCK
jgi:hypothetical protein